MGAKAATRKRAAWRVFIYFHFFLFLFSHMFHVCAYLIIFSLSNGTPKGIYWGGDNVHPWTRVGSLVPTRRARRVLGPSQGTMTDQRRPTDDASPDIAHVQLCSRGDQSTSVSRGVVNCRLFVEPTDRLPDKTVAARRADRTLYDHVVKFVSAFRARAVPRSVQAPGNSMKMQAPLAKDGAKTAKNASLPTPNVERLSPRVTALQR